MQGRTVKQYLPKVLFDTHYQQAAMRMYLVLPKTRYICQTSQSGIENSIYVSDRACRHNTFHLNTDSGSATTAATV